MSDDDTRDRAEIHDLFNRYADAIAGRQWELLDEVFTEDVTSESLGSPEIGGRATLVRRIRNVIEPTSMTHLLGNYTVAPFYQIESPEHATAQSHVDSNLNNDSAGDRTILNPAGVKNTGSGVTALLNTAGQTVAYLATNPNAQYIQAAVGARATAGRNTIPLARLDNLDMTVTKGVNFHERYRAEFSAQAFNVLNHHQFIPGQLHDVGSQGGYAGQTLYPQSSTFGQWSTVFGSNPRDMQLVAKFIF